MKTAYNIRAKKFIKQLYKYLGDTTERELRFACDTYCADHPSRKVKFASGCSRGVFITSDYAIKVNLKNGITAWGTSETELALWEKAKQDKMDFLFCPTEKYEYNGIDFYIMPKATRIGSFDPYENPIFRAYSNKVRLSDMHEGNVGIVNGRKVIIDYADNQV